MSHQGLFFEPHPLYTSPGAAEGEARTGQGGAEDAVWKRSRPSGGLQTHELLTRSQPIADYLKQR